MVDLITPDDVLDRLGRSYTPAEIGRIETLCKDVSAAVRARTKQTITTATTTELLKITNSGVVVLPQRPVTAVAGVTDELDNPLSYTWHDGDVELVLGSRYHLNAWELNLDRTFPLRKAKVEYTHGYATVPDDLVAVSCAIVIRALAVGPENTAVQESIAGYSYTLGSAAQGGVFGITADEREILEAYQPRAGAINLL